MSYSEALKYASEVERARDLAWDRLCDEEDKAIEEYNDFCNHLENEFKEFKAKYEIFTKKMLLNNGKIIMEYDIIDRNEILNSISLEIIPFI